MGQGSSPQREFSFLSCSTWLLGSYEYPMHSQGDCSCILLAGSMAPDSEQHSIFSQYSAQWQLRTLWEDQFFLLEYFQSSGYEVHNLNSNWILRLSECAINIKITASGELVNILPLLWKMLSFIEANWLSIFQLSILIEFLGNSLAVPLEMNKNSEWSCI